MASLLTARLPSFDARSTLAAPRRHGEMALIRCADHVRLRTRVAKLPGVSRRRAHPEDRRETHHTSIMSSVRPSRQASSGRAGWFTLRESTARSGSAPECGCRQCGPPSAYLAILSSVTLRPDLGSVTTSAPSFKAYVYSRSVFPELSDRWSLVADQVPL